MKRKQEASTGK